MTDTSAWNDFNRTVIDEFRANEGKVGGGFDPQWFRNLVANPDVTVEIGTEKFEDRARVAEDEERDRLFRRRPELHDPDCRRCRRGQVLAGQAPRAVTRAYAAESLRTDAIFLTPFGLHTRLNAQGEVYTDYWSPRPGPEVQKKVKQAWRNAGFRRLRDGVVWSPTRLTGAPTDDKRLDKTLARFVALQDDADSAKARAWWRRRIKRQADGPTTRA